MELLVDYCPCPICSDESKFDATQVNNLVPRLVRSLSRVLFAANFVGYDVCHTSRPVLSWA